MKRNGGDIRMKTGDRPVGKVIEICRVTAVKTGVGIGAAIMKDLGIAVDAAARVVTVEAGMDVGTIAVYNLCIRAAFPT